MEHPKCFVPEYFNNPTNKSMFLEGWQIPTFIRIRLLVVDFENNTVTPFFKNVKFFKN